VPALPEFLVAHPKVEVELELTRQLFRRHRQNSQANFQETHTPTREARIGPINGVIFKMKTMTRIAHMGAIADDRRPTRLALDGVLACTTLSRLVRQACR
jgi:hypothetical protein